MNYLEQCAASNKLESVTHQMAIIDVHILSLSRLIIMISYYHTG